MNELRGRCCRLVLGASSLFIRGVKGSESLSRAPPGDWVHPSLPPLDPPIKLKLVLNPV
jgi:hypothetical protein